MTTSAQTILEFSQRLKQLREAAIQPPWSYDEHEEEIHCDSLQEFGGDPVHIAEALGTMKSRTPNAVFICHAANTALVQAEIIRMMAEALYVYNESYDPLDGLLAEQTLSSCAQLIKELEK